MSEQTGQSEDTGVTDPNPGASVDENGVTQAADGATSGGEQVQKEEVDSGQGTQQSKSQGSKQRLRRKLRESEAEKAQLAEDNRKLHEKVDTLAQKVDGVINPPPPRPSRVNFESEEDYEDALLDWKIQKPAVPEQTAKETTPAKTATTPKVDENTRQILDNWHDSCDDAAEKYDDFAAVTFENKSLPITAMMSDALIESENGGEAVYFLGKNPAEAERIAALPLTGQVLAINELSKKFASTTTSAPDPIDTLEPGDAGSHKSTDPLLEGATFE